MELTHQNFLNHSLKTDRYKIYPLAGDASSRRYFRIIHDQISHVLMVWDPFNPRDYPFLSIQEHFLKHNIHVPLIIDMSPKDGLVLLEDLGDLTLERKFWESQNQENILEFYYKAIDELIKIHFPATEDKRGSCHAFKVIFDIEKFMWEMNYALENLIFGICKYELSEPTKKDLNASFFNICNRLDAEPKYICHRDYHSRNLMIKLDEMRVIDFQDARMGPLQYDLVSLLKDSYVQLNDEIESKIFQYYLNEIRQRITMGHSLVHFHEIYELQTIQRTFKACGSFASFYMQRGDTRYLKYLNPSLKKLLKTLAEFPQYKILTDILIDSGAFDRRFESL